MPVKIMIVDDQLLFKDGLKTVLDLEPDLKVIATATNGKEALTLLKSDALPDLILLDIRMPELDGVATVKLIKQEYPDIKVIMLTTFNDAEYVIEALAYGANGYLLKDIEIEKLVEAIHDAVEAKMVLPPLVAAQLAQGLNAIAPKKTGKVLSELSEREKEIAVMLTQGFSNKQIAMALFITEGTVRNYISALYNKIGVNDRTNAVIYLKTHGL
jgi:DNA-binding NarL/FixJ family response regulator